MQRRQFLNTLATVSVVSPLLLSSRLTQAATPPAQMASARIRERINAV